MGKISYIQTENAPKPVGPYSQAVRCGGFIFLSGQIAIDPKTGEVKNKASVTEQAKQCFQNISEVLKEAGIGFSEVVKVGVFLTDMGDFSEFNQVYESYFTDNKPARSCVAVKELPKAVSVEVELIAKDL